MVAGPAWPGYRPDVPASASLPTLRASLLLAMAGLALLPAPALAQRMSPALLGNKDPVNRDPDAPPRRANLPAPGDVVDFEADQLSYDEERQLVVASGRVKVSRDGYALLADRVEYARGSDSKAGEVVAIGNVQITDPSGNQALGDRITLSDSLKDGAIANMLLVLNDGGRLGAKAATHSDRRYTMDRAVYSPCAVVDSEGAGAGSRNPAAAGPGRFGADPLRHRAGSGLHHHPLALYRHQSGAGLSGAAAAEGRPNPSRWHVHLLASL